MSQRSVVWVAIFTVIGLMFWRLPQLVAEQEAVYKTYGLLLEADALIKQKYVHTVSHERLTEGAVRGMLRELDPYSGYIPARHRAWFESHSRGEYLGIGVEIGLRHGEVVVISPLEGGPAARAGIRSGDAILTVDGREIESLPLLEIEKLLAGSAGSEVTIGLRRKGEDRTRDVVIERGAVSVRTVRGLQQDQTGAWDYMIDPSMGIGYLRISSFTPSTVGDFDVAMRSMASAPLRGLIIDLRFNPGGLMHEAIKLVDRFVADGPILATVTRRRVVQQYLATKPGTQREVELVVLVNGGSASSSEIVAGSLQARKRAIIIGQRTFGKGSVQHVITLSDAQSAIKLTVAYYQLPNGRFIHRTPENERSDQWGVIPDMVVPGPADPPTLLDASARQLDQTLTVALEVLRDRLGSSPPAG